MLSLEQALQLIEPHVANVSAENGCEIVVVTEATLERPFGWVFFYQTKEFLSARTPAAQLAGNAPLLVNRFTGDVVVTGTALPVQEYISRYEASL
ncbi:MAG: hypothetical protein H7A20_09510 [Rhodanobacteraceae bacterium]|nr:hypothetical protein [Rhodanobacteraceae bacterium]HPF72819.1 YrhB domain-containing protein [Xanthomonadaceae bacterium]HRX98904.1 YrhB domain-containing protein [Xanthomonadaceae bacterium]